MTDYILRQDALDVMCEILCDGRENCDENTYCCSANLMKRVPAADVRPVVRGEWDDKSVAFFRKCSNCGCCIEWNKNPFLFREGEYNYCPNCGAWMEAGNG